MKRLLFILLLPCFISCSHTLPEAEKTAQAPAIYPDYTDVTIPRNIAPLNFRLTEPHQEAYAVFRTEGQEVVVRESGGQFRIPGRAWKSLLKAPSAITVTVYQKDSQWIQYAPFHLYVAEEPVDPYIAYRLIEPGYEIWGQMGIYQRDLESYAESAIMENHLTKNNCMNCHSFCMQDPAKMVFHMRESFPGTYLATDDIVEKLNTKTQQTISALVYPSWHPSGKYIAFSVNDTKQDFHLNDPNRLEVYDLASDVVLYDVEKHEITTAPALFSKGSFETFPTFSPDGKTLYFCTADSLPMPHSFGQLKYSLCAVSFDPETKQFGTEVDTLYAASEGKSASFPRVSPDGKHLLYTLSAYGNFSIWHTDADLYMIDLATKASRPMDALNSEQTDSYHSWSSNSRWVVFSSRRGDGLYTRPYIAYIDEGGKASKPFLLPQKDTGFYDRFMKSYNIPEFITGPVTVSRYRLSRTAKEEKGTDVRAGF